MDLDEKNHVYGGGVSIYLQNEFQYDQRDDLTFYPECNDVESLFLEMSLCGIWSSDWISGDCWALVEVCAPLSDILLLHWII